MVISFSFHFSFKANRIFLFLIMRQNKAAKQWVTTATSEQANEQERKKHIGSRARYKSKWDSKTQHNSIVWHFCRWVQANAKSHFKWNASVVCDFVAKRKTHFEYNSSIFSFCILALLVSSLFFVVFFSVTRSFGDCSSGVHPFDNAHLIPLFVIDFNGNLWICWRRNLLCRCRQIALYCIRQAILTETMKDWNWEWKKSNANAQY